MSNAKILIVEDDRKISEALKNYLERTEFNVVICSTGKNVVKEVKHNPPDLILLDILLPDKDGMTVCREIRPFSNVPIIFMTAKVDRTAPPTFQQKQAARKVLARKCGPSASECFETNAGGIISVCIALLARNFRGSDLNLLTFFSSSFQANLCPLNLRTILPWYLLPRVEKT
jgi:CheY-like chemotaxis protein